MIFKRILVSAVPIFLAITFCSGAFAGNGIEHYESEIDFSDFYVACLGEHVSGHVEISGKYREFDTPNGKTFHLVDNWQYTWEITGQLTGRIWFGRGASPFVVNSMKGETAQWGESMVARPIFGDGPKIKLNYRVKSTVNANGELVVAFDGLDGLPPEVWYECFGKN